MMIKILEMPLASRPPLPLALIWTYPALDFNFTSFMPQEHLQILRHESSAHIKAIIEQKEHLKHHSPLSVVEDSAPLKHRRKQSWSKSFSKLPFVHSLKSPGATPKTPSARLPLPSPFTGASEVVSTPTKLDDGAEADNDGEGDETDTKSDKEKTISERVQYWNPVSKGSEGHFLLDVRSTLTDQQSCNIHDTRTEVMQRWDPKRPSYRRAKQREVLPGLAAWALG